MTEDLLEEQSEVLAKLGTSAEGAHLRARMQSACLLSDMESFKVGHPSRALLCFQLFWDETVNNTIKCHEGCVLF